MFCLPKFVIILCAALAASSFELGPNDIIFHCFTRSNVQQSVPILPTQQSILESIVFLTTRPTVITIHDHGDSVTGNFNAFVVPTHIAVRDVNVLALDWSRGSAMYTQGLGNAPQVGRVIADFVNILIDIYGYPASEVSIVGHGIGAHIAGIAARHIRGNVPHIVGLDPALSGWAWHPEKLSPNAADLVEVVHATIGFYGYDEPLGHLDFYANGGSVQSGCPTFECSYQFSYIYYTESVLADATGANKFVGTNCDEWQQATSLTCDGERDVHFGGYLPKTGAGIYYFRTGAQSPYALG